MSTHTLSHNRTITPSHHHTHGHVCAGGTGQRTAYAFGGLRGVLLPVGVGFPEVLEIVCQSIGDALAPGFFHVYSLRE